MAMTAQAMCDAIRTEFDNITSSTKWKEGERPARDAYTRAFDKSLTEYVEENMDITYTWAGFLPPPASTSDPVTSFSSGLVIPNKTIGQPSTMESWARAIVACFTGAITTRDRLFHCCSGHTFNNPPACFATSTRQLSGRAFKYLFTDTCVAFSRR